jgi:hypothetical protein
MTSQLNQQEQALSGHVALQLPLIWSFTQTHHNTLQKMKYIVAYAPVMSYPYCWQPQESPLFHVYFKSNHVTSQYSNLQPDKFMPTSLLSAMPPLNHAEYPTPQEAAAKDNTEMRSVDSDETTLVLPAECSVTEITQPCIHTCDGLFICQLYSLPDLLEETECKEDTPLTLPFASFVSLSQLIIVI